MPDFVNAHVMNAKVLVPTAQFGRMRGGKLLALLSQSMKLETSLMKNIREYCLGIQCLYGTTKSSCQYDQLDRYQVHR